MADLDRFGRSIPRPWFRAVRALTCHENIEDALPFFLKAIRRVVSEDPAVATGVEFVSQVVVNAANAVSGEESRRASGRSLETQLEGCDPALAEAAKLVFRSRSVSLDPSTMVVSMTGEESTRVVIAHQIFAAWATDQTTSGPAAAWAVGQEFLNISEFAHRGRSLRAALHASSQLRALAACVVEKRDIPSSLVRRKRRHASRRPTESMINESFTALMAS